MKTQIEAINYFLPECQVTNDEMGRENPTWRLENVEAKSGVRSRHVAAQTETSFDLGLRACDKLFAETGLAPNDVDGVIFCTQSPDYIMPSNSHLLHKHYDMKREVIAFDMNLACSGYIYALAMAHSLLTTRLARRILVVTAETYSKYIHPKDRSSRVLFGDGAAATFVTSTSDGDRGILDLELGSSGRGYESFYIPAGGMRQPRGPETSVEVSDSGGNIRTLEHIHMDGFRVWSFINSTIPPHVEKLLSRNQLQVADIDQFIFHQASQMTLDSLMKAMKLDASKVFLSLSNKGNTVSASIPIALKEAEAKGAIRRGDRILLCGFGVGFSYGSILLRY